MVLSRVQGARKYDGCGGEVGVAEQMQRSETSNPGTGQKKSDVEEKNFIHRESQSAYGHFRGTMN